MRDGWRRLRRLGLRRWLRLERGTLRQMAKTALAATLSWELADRLLHSPLPALAALGAILTVQGTVKGPSTFGIQQVVGVTVGVGAALLAARVLGVHTWSVGLVILGALVVGNLLRLGRQTNQVAISALLVLALGTATAASGWWTPCSARWSACWSTRWWRRRRTSRRPPSRSPGSARTSGCCSPTSAPGCAATGTRRSRRDWLHRARELDAAAAGGRRGGPPRRREPALQPARQRRGGVGGQAHRGAHRAGARRDADARDRPGAVRPAPATRPRRRCWPGWPTCWSRPGRRWRRSGGCSGRAARPARDELSRAHDAAVAARAGLRRAAACPRSRTRARWCRSSSTPAGCCTRSTRPPARTPARSDAGALVGPALLRRRRRRRRPQPPAERQHDTHPEQEPDHVHQVGDLPAAGHPHPVRVERPGAGSRSRARARPAAAAGRRTGS